MNPRNMSMATINTCQASKKSRKTCDYKIEQNIQQT